jgi:cytochrome c1
MTGESIREVRETDKLFAGPDMSCHVEKAISNGELVTELTVFELHPALHVKRIHTSR